jgi:hypothetical protein
MSKENRRPPIGPRIARGLRLWPPNLRERFAHGFLPSEWSARDRRDARAAVMYMYDLAAWYGKERRRHDQVQGNE